MTLKSAKAALFLVVLTFWWFLWKLAKPFLLFSFALKQKFMKISEKLPTNKSVSYVKISIPIIYWHKKRRVLRILFEILFLWAKVRFLTKIFFVGGIARNRVHNIHSNQIFCCFWCFEQKMRGKSDSETRTIFLI